MEAEKTVSEDVEVSDITTAFITTLLPMPVCRYEVLDGSPTGQPVNFAVVGQQVRDYIVIVLLSFIIILQLQ